jgi:hypothetical protein
MADEKFRVLAEINRRSKEKPVLVGGGAVEFYSGGHFVTGDMDLCARTAALAEVLRDMGFRKEGMYFIRGKLFIHVLGPGFKGRSDEVAIGKGLSIRVISLEDLIIDRLNSCKWWKHAVDCEQALYLLNTYAEQLDYGYLEERADQDEVRDTLEELKPGRRDRTKKGTKK